MADIQDNSGHPAKAEREAIADYVRKQFGAAGVHMMLAAGMPGGTRTQRVKNAAFADGFAKAACLIAKAVEAGDHHTKNMGE